MARQDETILIALDYLLNYTDENHKTNATDINEYALETYGVSIDRRCVNRFLARLKALCDEHPDKFPFILQSNDKQRPRYYLEQKYFSKDDIIAIASAIKDTFQIDQETSKELIENFVDVTTSRYQRKEIMDILSSEPIKSGKILASTAEKVRQINRAIDEKRRIEYVSVDDETTTHNDYFYKIFYVAEEPIAIVLRDGKLISERISEINILRLGERWYDDPRCRFRISDLYRGRYRNPDEEIRAVRVPVADPFMIQDCFFSFENDSHMIDSVRYHYDKFFHMPLEYDVGDDGRCRAKIRTKIMEFLMWSSQYDVAKLIKVTGNEEVLKALETHYKEMLQRNNLNQYRISFNDHGSAQIRKPPTWGPKAK